MEPAERDSLPGLSFGAALSQDKAEAAASPPSLPASRRASKAVVARRVSHLQATPSGRSGLTAIEMDAVERIVNQRRLQVNTEAMSALPFAGASADIVLESASSHVPAFWLRNTVKRTRGRRRLALFGARTGDAFAVEDAWERCLYRSEPAPHGPLSQSIFQPQRDTPGGVERREACVAQLQANHAQNVFMLVVPVVAGLHSFSPGEDPVVAAIAFARYADGQRHVVALLPGMMDKARHADLGGASEVERLLHLAINGEALPSGLRVLRSRDAAVLEDIDGDAVKALDFGGRVTMASTKNLQLQWESRAKAWPQLKVQPDNKRWSSPSTLSSRSPSSTGRGPPLALQCGRVGRDTFICDHNDNAMSGLQAFAIALAVFTWHPHYLWL